MHIKISDIKVVDRKRKINLEKVKEISESIKEIGLIHPIVVHEKDNRLIAGMHRLEAVKFLGWSEIEAIYINHNDLDSELVEIDENLMREELKYIDRGDFLARRKAIYEEKYPQSKSTNEGGAFRGNQYTKEVTALSAVSTNISKSFVEDTSNKTGISERTLMEDIQISTSLSEEVKEFVKEKDLPKKEALALARLEKDEQKEIIEKITTGKAKSVKQAIKNKKYQEALDEVKKQSALNSNEPILWKKDFLKDAEFDVITIEGCDLLITDPPYSTNVEDIHYFAKKWLPRTLACLKSTGRAYIFIGAYPEELYAYLNVWNNIESYVEDFDDLYDLKTPYFSHLKLVQILVWTYRNTLGPSPNRDYKQNWQAILYFRGNEAKELDCPLMTEQFTVQDINAPDGRLGNRYHAWQKPDELAERLIRHSTKPGDIVFDPFAGTGTFILAANRLGRKGYGLEVDDEMIKIAIERGCRIEEDNNE